MGVRKCYIRYREGVPDTTEQYSVYEGFRKRGIETEPFYGFGDIENIKDLGPEVMIAGYLGDVWQGLELVGVGRPEAIDYPEELKWLLGREIQSMSLKAVRNITDKGLFVKPVNHKVFTGFVCTGTFQDNIRIGPYPDDEPMWVSEPINFISEYRCFVLEGEILGVKHYKGDPHVCVSKESLFEAVHLYKNAPIAYTIDLGVTDRGFTLLVEVNDAMSFGGYGLDPVMHSRMVEARWMELVNDNLP